MTFGGYSHIIISTVVVYLFIIVAIRMFGKKELAQLSVVDLVFILLISNAVQNAMVGSDSSLPGGLIAASVLFLINSVMKYLLYRFPKFNKAVQGEAILLIYQGRLIHRNIERARLTIDEIHEAIREHGVTTVEGVDLAILEVDGNISVLSDEYAKKTSRKRRTQKGLSNMQP